MGTFDTQWTKLQDADEAAFVDSSATVSYVSKGGATTEITAIVGKETFSDEDTDQGLRRIGYRNITVWANQEDDNGDVIVPAKNATVQIDGDIYHIWEVVQFSNQFIVRMSRLVMAEVTRDGYRSKARGKRGSYR